MEVGIKRNRKVSHIKNKQTQKLLHTFSVASLGSEFVIIGQAGEAAGQRSNEIRFNTSYSQTLPSLNL